MNQVTANNIAALPLPAPIEGWRGGSIRVFSDWSVFELLYPAPAGKSFYDNPEYYADGWKKSIAKLMAYCDSHDMHYYGRCKEDFFVFEALDEASKAGKRNVVLDNMS